VFFDSVLLMTSSAPLQDEPAFAHAHKALIKHSDYQFNLPTFHRPQPPEWVVALVRFLEHNWRFIKWGVWIVAAALLLWAAFAVVRTYLPMLSSALRKRRLNPKPAPVEWRPTSSAARELLRESDSLAAVGQYGHAVHLLLLRSIEDIDKQRPNLVRPNFTSREIGMLQPLPETARNTFVGIASVVERALFAGEAIGAGEFASCRAAYERFAFPDAWSAPA
jgi:hypothetical protein